MRNGKLGSRWRLRQSQSGGVAQRPRGSPAGGDIQQGRSSVVPAGALMLQGQGVVGGDGLCRVSGQSGQLQGCSSGSRWDRCGVGGAGGSSGWRMFS